MEITITKDERLSHGKATQICLYNIRSSIFQKTSFGKYTRELRGSLKGNARENLGSLGGQNEDLIVRRMKSSRKSEIRAVDSDLRW